MGEEKERPSGRIVQTARYPCAIDVWTDAPEITKGSPHVLRDNGGCLEIVGVGSVGEGGAAWVVPADDGSVTWQIKYVCMVCGGPTPCGEHRHARAYPTPRLMNCDDGSAAHEPVNYETVKVAQVGTSTFTVAPSSAAHELVSVERLRLAEVRIDSLREDRSLLRRENERLRALLSRAEESPAVNPADAVQSDIDRTLDHLFKGKTTAKQREDLTTATQKAQRDAAVGRAIR